MTHDGEGGHHLHLHCAACPARAEFRGVVMGLAADRARAAGWDFEGVLHTPPGGRYAACPEHA